MRKSKEVKLKEEINKLIEEYLSTATKEELIALVGFLQGCISIKKLGDEPSLEDEI